MQVKRFTIYLRHFLLGKKNNDARDSSGSFLSWYQHSSTNDSLQKFVQILLKFLKVVALGNFKDFGIYFKIGYYLRISANKFEYLSVTRISTWLFYANIVVALYLLIINLLPCPLGTINLKNLIFCGREIKILSFFLRILQTLTLWIITSLQSPKEAEFKLLSRNFQFSPEIDGSRGIWMTT